MNGSDLSVRTILRVLFVVLGVLLALYLLYLLRKPIGWILAATFLAIALSGPVNFFDRWLPRGLSITVVYLCLLLVPVAIAGIVVPPLVDGGQDLANNAPQYASDVTEFVEENETLRNLDKDYDITSKLQEEAAKLPSKVGDAAGILSDIGIGLVNSVFQLITILILAAFMLGSGRNWVHNGLRFLDTERAARLERVLNRSARAVGNYVAGALFQATIAGIVAYIVLQILGVPFAAPLALVVFFLDLIPLIGATIGAVLVGLVTVFNDFPTVTIIWVVFSIAYQQIENTLIQPQIQKRAVNVNPFLVVVSVLCGSALLGVVGALIAVPVAASIQIALREWADYRGIRPRELPEEGPPAPPPEGPEPDAPPAPA